LPPLSALSVFGGIYLETPCDWLLPPLRCFHQDFVFFPNPPPPPPLFAVPFFFFSEFRPLFGRLLSGPIALRFLPLLCVHFDNLFILFPPLPFLPFFSGELYPPGRTLSKPFFVAGCGSICWLPLLSPGANFFLVCGTFFFSPSLSFPFPCLFCVFRVRPP